MKKIIILLILPFLVLSSCSDDRLENDDLTTGEQVVGFAKSKYNLAYFEDEGTVQLSIPVKLIGLGDGYYSEEDIQVSYEVVEEESSASDGEEFTVSSSSVSIPAGQDFGEIVLDINTGNMNETEPTELVLKLTSASDGVIAYNKDKVIIEFVGCVTELEGDYLAYVNGEPQMETVIEKVAPNVYRTELPGVSAGGRLLWVEFSDACGDLNMVDWEFQGGYAIVNPNTGTFPSGSVNEDGEIVFSHVSLTGLGFYQNNEVKYVPQ